MALEFNQNQMERLNPDWNARKYIELYSFFLGNLCAMYPECPMVAKEKGMVDGLVGAPPDVLDTYIQEWHEDMDKQVTVGGDTMSLYTMVKKRDPYFFRGQSSMCGRLGFDTKWWAGDLDTASKDSVWQYLTKLNRYARFTVLAPRKIMGVIAEVAASGADITNPAVMEGMVERLGPEVAVNFEQLRNATGFVEDLMEEFLGTDMTGQLLGMVESLTGQLGDNPQSLDLQQLTSMIPSLMGCDMTGVDANELQSQVNAMLANITPDMQSQVQSLMDSVQKK